MTNSRVLAAQTLLQLVDQGRSLNDLLPARREQLPEAERGFYQQLVYGCARHYLSLDELTRKLLNKPIQRKERVVHMLLVVGLYQLWQLDLPEHAALYETVDGTKTLKKPWAAKLLNAALRRFQREGDELIAGLQNGSGYPGWLTRQLRQAYPDQWQPLLEAGNVQGPMTLRINRSRLERDTWLAQADDDGLAATACAQTVCAVTLAQPVPVHAIPGFSDGEVSVQDEAAQQCALLLAPQDGERVLDACAAPGGKTGHLLESAKVEVTALDIDDSRLQRVTENLERLGLSAKLQAADAADINSWWDGKVFDRILLDAPCSGTGVIRRHPDIKLLRRPKDIEFLLQVQDRLLTQLWRTLKPGGRLLYATCSILPQENNDRIAAFLQRQTDARLLPITLAGDAPAEFGVQWLPQPGGHDGFYFALLEKADSTAA